MIEQLSAPEHRRFTPTRAGIINLWDYRDEEFVFVDGWLVLRGPNGSGKTKALEVLFPFVLDGRIEPRRLNPFASEERTMKSNLLYRGQEVTHAYVWLELSDGDGFVTLGIGLRAHRHVDRVTRWHFLTEGRVGVDFSLLDGDDRPLNRRDLIAGLGPDAVRDSAEEHRRAVDTRLFGLGPARYEQLLDLVLTLRKPQLAKDLNPAELSRTLQRGLRPLDEHLIVDAAGSFDDMEAVARTLEGLVAADQATTAFLSVYATYLRTHARAAADALTSRRAAVDQHRAELVAAREALAAATDAEQLARAALAGAEPEPGRLRARLDSVKSSHAYRSRQQLADLERHVHDLATAAEQATAAVAAEQQVVSRRRAEAERAAAEEHETATAAHRLGIELAADAEAAGIAWDAAPATGELAAAVSAAVTARRDDVRAVRSCSGRLAEAEGVHARASQDAQEAAAVVADAEHQQQEAATAVAQARSQLLTDLDGWAERHRSLLAPLSVPQLLPQLAAAVDTLGEPGAASLTEVYAATTAPAVTACREALAGLRAQREELARRRADVAGERERIASQRDDAPPAPATRVATRDDRPGAPLWRLVRFADHVAEADAAGLEAALLAAGLLDAWLHPDPDATAAALAASEQDGHLLPASPAGRPAPGTTTLADVLEPEQQDLVPLERVAEVLASISLSEVVTAQAPGAGAVASVSTAGRFAHGLTVGSHHKPAPEYIGATARAARRVARLAECDRHLVDLDAELSDVDRQRQHHQRLLSGVDEAAAALPPATGVHAALRASDQAAARLAARREAETTAAARLDQAVADRAAATAALRRMVAERSLPAEQVDEVAEATGRFERTGLRLDHARRSAARSAEAAQQAGSRHEEAVERHLAAEQAAAGAAARHREKDEAYQVLHAAVGPDGDRVLAEAAELAEQITAAERTVSAARERLGIAREQHASARTRVELEERAVAAAVADAAREAARLRPYARADLLGLLRCPTDLRWPASPAADAGELDPQVVALHDAVLAATSALSPTETSLKQSATRLTTALTDLQAQLPAAGLDHRPEWDTDDGVIVVRVADEQGLTPVAQFAERVARQRRDQEQLLTEAEQRILEDALLGQLARQIHTRTIEARDLVAGMDEQMRARRMSSGLTVGVGWRISDELDSEQREVCKLLDRDPARLGPSQLATLRRHFASRIKAARALAPEQPYRELLAQVLDYRQWRTFAFALHRPGRAAEPLTRARHSQLSGGEQSVSLHLPLFAAANALFGSARPDAPRLLGLDEAFAGVDETGRGELMSLARQFDLDLFMTGYDLWATGAAVRGSAHYDLSHSAVEHTVSTVLLVWDGEANVADFDGTLARALGSPQTRRVPAALAGAAEPALVVDA